METTGGYAMTASPNNTNEWNEAFTALENPVLYQDRVQEGLRWVEPLRGTKAWKYHLEDIQELPLKRCAQL
jgi:hypothetical protein